MLMRVASRALQGTGRAPRFGRGIWQRLATRHQQLSMKLPFVLVVVLLLVLDAMTWFRGRGRAGGRSGSCPDPSQEGSRRSSAPCQFLSWEGLGAGSAAQLSTS